MSQLYWILLLLTIPSSLLTSWTSLGSGGSPHSRKTDVPEIQDGWTSLLASNREGRFLTSNEKSGGWTSLLNNHDQVDSADEKAAKIIATSEYDK